MTATQAPTPGPLSSDASHIYRETSDASGRLAPVEASGSEREDIQRWQADQSEFFQSNVLEVVTEYATWRDRQEALRPQPSGETRALLERIAAVRARKDFTPQQANAGLLTVLDDCAAALALEGQQEDWRCPDCGAQADEWFDCCKNPARAEAQDAEAKRSRAAFLDSKCSDDEWAGLEAQVLRDEAAQDEGATAPLTDDQWPLAYERLKGEIPHPDQGIALVGCDDLAMALYRLDQFATLAMENAARAHPSPTPAADAVRSEPDDPTEEMIQAGLKVDFDNEDERGAVINLWHVMKAAAPPAADADRVRVAVEEVADAVDFFDRVKASTQAEQIAVGRDHWNRLEAAARAVAALKSTAAKEGGA